MSLRRRFALATGALLALQAVGGGAAAWSGVAVVGAVDGERALLGARAAVAAVGDAVREQYVHQAHTFIEGGTAHLDHYADAVADTERRLAAVDALTPLVPPRERDELRAAVRAFADAFAERVVPVARAGWLDRPVAAALHADAERRAAAVDTAVHALLASLDARADAERARAARAARVLGLVLAVLPLLALGVVLLVTRSLAGAVLGPLDALAGAARRFGAGDRAARARLGTVDTELRAVGAAFDDMAGRVAAEEDRRIAAGRLAALGEMSAAVAHELLNPIATILGRTDDPVVREEADHARRVVTGLLGFARPGDEAPEEVDVVRAAQHAVARAALVADVAEVRLTCRAVAASSVWAPPSAVRQVLDNLLRNAIEASPRGADVEVDVADARVEIRDRGPGVPPAVVARLYEPFVTGRAQGTGLGLAVARRIVVALGGELSHVSRNGGGTVARWRLRG